MDERRRRSAKQWASLVRAWRRSGVPAAAFAASRGLNTATLKWWAWRLSSRAHAADSPRLVAVQVTGDAGVSPGVDAPSPFCCEIAVSGGDVVRVFAGAPVEILRAAIEASLSSKCAGRH